MKKILSLLLLCTVQCALCTLKAQTFTPTSEAAMTQDGVTVSFDKGNGNNPPKWYDNGLRLYASNTITVSGNAITTVKLVFTKQGSKPYATLAANTGTLVSGGESTAADDEKADIWTGSASSVTFTLGASGQRLVKQIIVNGDTTQVGGGGGTTGGGKDTTSTVNPTLDPNYIYSEPTTIGVPATPQSAGVQSFVENNILVEITQGAIYADYFNCYAGKSITFSAAKPIKAIVITGMIKKDFSATASAGAIDYMDASEEDTEGDPVLIVTDINATSVTLNCVKQLRCYSVDFYFEANPDVEIGAGGGDYSYEWEPTTPTTITATMDYAAAYDFTEGYGLVELYLENDDYFADLYVLADYDAVLGVPAGTYQVASSGETGTIWASSGGNDDEDEPSYLAADFDAEGYYSTTYYFAGGTLTVSPSAQGARYEMAITSHFGSTLNLTYEGPVENGLGTGVEQTADDSRQAAGAVKAIRDGQLVIIREGKRYNVLGAEY